MDKRYTKGRMPSSRTAYRLTDEDVVEALVLFVASKGETIPEGKRGVAVRDPGAYYPQDEGPGPLATLVIDHVEPEGGEDERGN